MARTEAQRRLIADALDVLESFGIPTAEMPPHRREKTAVSFLTLAGMRPGRRWRNAADIDEIALRTRDMIQYMVTVHVVPSKMGAERVHRRLSCLGSEFPQNHVNSYST